MKTLQSIIDYRVNNYTRNLNAIANAGGSITKQEYEIISDGIDFFESIDYYGCANNLRALVSLVTVRNEIMSELINVD